MPRDETPLPAIIEAEAEPPASPALPLDLENQRQKIMRTNHDVAEIYRTTDALFLRWIGWDAILGVVPGVGAIYSGYKGLSLVRAAHDLRTSFGLRVYIYCMILIDIFVGFVVGVGDLLDLAFRAHGIVAKRLGDEAERQLHLFDVTQQRLFGVPGDQVPDHPAVTELRDQLFRDGRTEDQHKKRLLIIGGVIAALFAVSLFSD